MVHQHGKRKCFHKKRVELPQDWLGTPTWPLSHCFSTSIRLPLSHVHALYTLSLPYSGVLLAFCLLKSTILNLLTREIKIPDIFTYSCFFFNQIFFSCSVSPTILAIFHQVSILLGHFAEYLLLTNPRL